MPHVNLTEHDPDSFGPASLHVLVQHVRFSNL